MKTNKIDFELEDLEGVLSVKTSYLTRNIRYDKVKSFGVIAESVNSSNWHCMMGWTRTREWVMNYVLIIILIHPTYRLSTFKTI